MVIGTGEKSHDTPSKIYLRRLDDEERGRKWFLSFLRPKLEAGKRVSRGHRYRTKKVRIEKTREKQSDVKVICDVVFLKKRERKNDRC